MNIGQAVILGIVQGLTEFLPVSSSGHLVLVQRIFQKVWGGEGIAEPGLFFDTLLHCGTLVAVFFVFRRDIWNILRRPFQRFTWLLILATAVTAVVAFGFMDTLEEAFASGRWLGQAFLVTGAALFLSEYLSRLPGDSRNDAEMGWFDAVFIGALQGIAAILPGVSRSGFTLSGALSRRLERNLAARFSFLLSIPAILGGLAVQIKEMMEISGFQSINPEASSGLTGGVDIIPAIAGTVTAALVGFASIVLLLKMIRERSLVGFGVYTAVLGLLVLLDQNVTHWVF
ncbi:MAG: undecaprenyl-diphosphate phosphatase [Treponema sp.]|jgi:undecaprenyl-diphosphatase|nr:undecaprenyl-diphosphate phosphatase [Treponema sp.]